MVFKHLRRRCPWKDTGALDIETAKAKSSADPG